MSYQSYLSSIRSESRQATIDMFCIVSIYGSCALSILSIQFFLVSIVLSLYMACRLNDIAIGSKLYQLFCVYDENSKLDQFIDRITHVLACSTFPIGMAIVGLDMAPLWQDSIVMSLVAITMIAMLFDNETFKH